MRENPDEDETPERAYPTAQPGREPAFNLAPVVLAIIAFCVVVEVVRVFLLTPEQDIDLILRTAFIPLRYSGGFDVDVWAFVSPVSYSLLHGSWTHLAINMVWLAAFGSPLAHRLGAMRFLLFWVVTSLGAVALHYALHAGEPIPLVGASGAISGMMGAAARYGFRIDRSRRRPAFDGRLLGIGEALRSRTVVVFLGIWFAVNLVTGLGYLIPDVDGAIAWEAHIGGFLAGFLLVAPFDRRPADPQA